MHQIRSLDDIGFYTLSAARAERVAALYRLDDPLAFDIVRTEIVLGRQCNLNCSFCKGLQDNDQAPAADYFNPVLKKWIGATQFVHITGGEPTVWPDLPDLVSSVTAFGATPCMTTNGLADFSLYKTLVEKGLRDIRISLHAHTPELYRQITGKDGFKKAASNIRRIIRLRDAGTPDLYVMINVCVLEETLDHIADLIRFLMDFKPDDIKPVAVVQWPPDRLKRGRAHYDRVLLPRLREITPENRFPILRYRLPTLLTRRLRGFRDAEKPGGRPIPPQCFLMLDDRCVDERRYYPCNIYLRERGKPLGSYQKDDRRVAAEKIWRFVRDYDVRMDPVCRSCCPDVVGEYNRYVSALVQSDLTAPVSRPALVC